MRRVSEHLRSPGWWQGSGGQEAREPGMCRPREHGGGVAWRAVSAVSDECRALPGAVVAGLASLEEGHVGEGRRMMI